MRIIKSSDSEVRVAHPSPEVVRYLDSLPSPGEIPGVSCDVEWSKQTSDTTWYAGIACLPELKKLHVLALIAAGKLSPAEGAIGDRFLREQVIPERA